MFASLTWVASLLLFVVRVAFVLFEEFFPIAVSSSVVKLTDRTTETYYNNKYIGWERTYRFEILSVMSGVKEWTWASLGHSKL